MNSEYHIEARGLNKKFGYKTALRHIDIFLEEGGSLALFGPNGAGKSTLIQVLCSLLQPTSGSVRIAGYDAQGDREALHQIIGLIAHQTFLYPHLTAYENLKFYGTMYALDRLDARIKDVLDRVGLSDHVFGRTVYRPGPAGSRGFYKIDFAISRPGENRHHGLA